MPPLFLFASSCVTFGLFVSEILPPKALVYLCWTVVLLSCGSISLWFQVQKKGVLHWCPSMVQDWMYNLSLLEFLTDPTMADYLGKFTPLFVGPNEQELKGILASFPRTTREALLTKRMVDTFPDPVRALLTGNDGADRAERFSARSKDLLRDCEDLDYVLVEDWLFAKETLPATGFDFDFDF